jgi:Flp pilus assembly protein TadG
MRRRLRTGLADERGATAAEFALIMPAFTMMVFVLIEISMMMYMGASVQWALDRASRQVITNSDTTVAEIEDQMDEYLAAAGSPDVDVSYAVDDWAAVPIVRVTAHYDHVVDAPFIPQFTVGFDFQTLIPQADPGA